MPSNAKAFGLIGLLVAAACSRALSLEGLPCPCGDGYECCGDVCSLTCSKAKTEDDERADESVKTLAMNEQPGCMTADPSAVFWMNEDGTVAGASTVAAGADAHVIRSRANPPLQSLKKCGIVRAGAGLYVTAPTSNAVYWISVDWAGVNPGIGDALMKVGSFASPSSIVVDDVYLYVLEDGGALRRMPRPDLNPIVDAGAAADGGDAGMMDLSGTVLGQGGTSAALLVADADSLYWSDTTGVRKMSKQGGPVTTLAPSKVRELHVANGYAFWPGSGSDIGVIPTGGGVPQELAVTLPQERTTASKSTKVSTDELPDDTTQSVGALAFETGAFGNQILVARNDFVDRVGFAGGAEQRIFRFENRYGVKQRISFLLFDTQRYIWVTEDGTISFRGVLASDSNP